MEIVLASASERRCELLRRLGLQFTVDPSDCAEEVFAGLGPAQRARRISLEKARIVAARHPCSLIIAADTFGVLRGRILGKPRTPDEAVLMLKVLSGKTHRVITGLTVLDTASGRSVSRLVTTRVIFRRLRRGEIESYVKTGEPLGKAGAYAIQGRGALLVNRIEGDFYNVVGLPLSVLAQVLKRFGIKIL